MAMNDLDLALLSPLSVHRSIAIERFSQTAGVDFSLAIVNNQMSRNLKKKDSSLTNDVRDSESKENETRQYVVYRVDSTVAFDDDDAHVYRT
jgi:hypothetical protein